MLNVKVDASQVTALAKHIKDSSKRFDKDFKEIFDGIKKPVLGIAREEAPKKSKRLAESLHVVDYAPLEFGIEEGVNYGQYVRHGTPARGIFPRVTFALFWKGLPHPVAHAKNWPGKGRSGTKPNPYGERTATRARREILPRFGEKVAARIRIIVEGKEY